MFSKKTNSTLATLASATILGMFPAAGAAQSSCYLVEVANRAASAVLSNVCGQVLNESAKLLPSDGAAGDEFGEYVSVFGDVAVVSARLDDDNGSQSGSVYVFRRNESSWTQEQKLLASDGVGGDGFGAYVFMSGPVIVVGAPGNDASTGAAYVFRWNGSAWQQEQKLVPSDAVAGDSVASRVWVNGNVIVVGSCCHDANGTDAGAAWVFRWNGSVWIEEQKLLASDGEPFDRFGEEVAVFGDVVVASARWDDDNGIDAGAAYVFRHNGSTWVQEQKLLASDGAAGDEFRDASEITSRFRRGCVMISLRLGGAQGFSQGRLHATLRYGD